MADASRELPVAPERVKSPRLLREIAKGFTERHPDHEFDSLVQGLVDGDDLEPSQLLTGLVRPILGKPGEAMHDSMQRVHRVYVLESYPHQYISRLRDKVVQRCSPEIRRNVLAALLYTIRLHIDDRDRSDTGLPGVSHQLEVADNVLDVILKSKSPGEHISGREAEIFVAALWHDAVEDHQRLIMLESDEIIKLMEKKDTDGNYIISEDVSVPELSIKLLGEHSTPFIEQLLTGLTIDRSKLLETWYGYSRDEAREVVRADDERGGLISEDDKRYLYEQYVLETFTDPSEAGEAKSLIKLTDLMNNATTIGKIAQRVDHMERGLAPYDAELVRRLKKTFNKLRDKYESVLIILRDQLLPAWRPDTLVGSMREQFRTEIDKALTAVYQRRFEV